MNVLLATIENPISQNQFSREFESLKAISRMRRSKRRTERLTKILDDFNNGIHAVLNDLQIKANDVLHIFEQNTTIDFEFPHIEIDDSRKTLLNTTIRIKCKYYNDVVTSHHLFLNEARLSAIALSIYLGGLLLIPPSQLRILFLDDVLIGLDMSNRLPLLDVLSKYFTDWQIFLTTYDYVWFTMIKKRIEGWVPQWEYAEFYCGKTSEGDIPLYAKNRHDYLDIAQAHLDANDLKAAAIYIRSAYEHEMKYFADKHRLCIRYCENPKDLKAQYFWDIIKKIKLTNGELVLNGDVVRNVELFRTTILNQLSHTESIIPTRQEVVAAKKAIKSMKDKLDSIAKENIQL